MRATTSLVFALTSLTIVAACGDDGGSRTIDAGMNPATCTVSNLYFGAKGALTGASIYGASAANPAIGSMSQVAPLETGDPADILLVEFYPGFAPFGTQAAPTAVVPGTYQITANQLQYADCAICVRIGTNATTTAYDDDYLATGGTVTITAADGRVGGTLTYTVSNLTFEHVNIAAAPSFMSTPTNDGCHANVTSATSTSTMAAPPQQKTGVVQIGTSKRLVLR